MTITAPIDVEALGGELDIIDDIQILDDLPLVATAEALPLWRDPLVPFLALGVLSLIATIVTAALLAF